MKTTGNAGVYKIKHEACNVKHTVRLVKHYFV